MLVSRLRSPGRWLAFRREWVFVCVFGFLSPRSFGFLGFSWLFLRFLVLFLCFLLRFRDFFFWGILSFLSFVFSLSFAIFYSLLFHLEPSFSLAISLYPFFPSLYSTITPLISLPLSLFPSLYSLPFLQLSPSPSLSLGNEDIWETGRISAEKANPGAPMISIPNNWIILALAYVRSE